MPGTVALLNKCIRCPHLAICCLSFNLMTLSDTMADTFELQLTRRERQVQIHLSCNSCFTLCVFTAWAFARDFNRGLRQVRIAHNLLCVFHVITSVVDLTLKTDPPTPVAQS